MIYLGNGIWSDSGPSLSHGGTWREHKYIAIKNGRYIYPDDNNRVKVKKYNDAVSSQGPSQAEKAQSYVYNPYFKNPQYDPNHMDTYRLSKNVDNGKQNESQAKKYWNMEKNYYDKYKHDMSPVGKNALAALGTAKLVGYDVKNNLKDLKNAAGEKVKEIKDKKKYGKLYGTIKVTEPSAAQKAQSYSSSGTVSKNTYTGKTDFNKRMYESNPTITNQGPSQAELAQRGGVATSSKNVSTGAGVNKNGKNPTKYAKRPDGKDPNPKPGDHQHDIGKAPNSKAPRDNGNLSRTRFYAKNKKFNKAVSSQGPSAAEKAQRGMTKGSSKNVSTGSKTVQYQKKLSDTNKTYQKAVSSQGPSAAEKAQREKGSKKKPQSKNVNTGKPNKKKKNPFKELAKWIKGSEGKVSVR